MKRLPAAFCVIQYCPDHSRLEAANVGVVLLCPAANFLDAKVSPGCARATKFFGHDDVDIFHVKSATKAVKNMLKRERDNIHTADDLAAFAAKLGNDITLTPPRPMVVADPEADLADLFDQLVEVRGRERIKAPEFDELDRLLRAPALSGRVQFDQRVEVPKLGKMLVVDYAYRNGVCNLVKTQRFSANEASAKQRAGMLAINGSLLHRHVEGEERKLIVVSSFVTPASRATLKPTVTDLLSEFDVRLIDSTEIPCFVEQVKREAH